MIKAIPDERLDDVERTFITLSFKKKADKKPIKADKKPIKADKERVESILEYINQNETITNKEARELLNLADSTTKRLLAQMVLDGLIEAIGENKNRKYILKK
jgi:predicted HTH transcriptional regulator